MVVTQLLRKHQGRPVLTDKSTAALFDEGYKLENERQELLHTNQIHAAQGLLWHGDALVVPDFKYFWQMASTGQSECSWNRQQNRHW